MKAFYKPLFILFTILLYVNCARTGRPDGGPKDEEAPLFVTADPPYETVNFKEKEVKIEFNEFIKLKNINKQFVVSPPLKNPPLITPQGSASKSIKIEILDTLQPNVTYIFNFGNAVEDNNEGNKLENFKYVFSTGSYIDSLKTSGFVKDAKSTKKIKNINVLLYRIDSSFNDSIIYKKKPNYITSTLDSTLFNFTNLHKGNYLMIALKESANDYIFNPVTDKIGFIKDTIQLPRDSIISKPIILFSENLPFDFKRGKEITRGKLEFGYVGNVKDLKLELLSKVPDSFKSVSKFMIDKDTLNFWHTPVDLDSLNFKVTNREYIDTVTVRLRKNKIDSLQISVSTRNTLHLRDTFFVNTNNPIVKIDTSKISLFDKDTIAVNFKTISSKKENKIAILFDIKPQQKYRIVALPEAFTDIFNVKNDTLKYSLTTKEIEDYGRITVNVNNLKNKNVIIDLLSGTKQDELVERKIITSSSQIVFDLLRPRKYTLRAIVDENKNNKWDTGDFLKKLLPEKIMYHPEISDYPLRANFFLENINFVIE
ncbi:Ig-like domain-containing protein [Polaribacter marinivivus]|uniref:Ig-like domain-containing protein n=1 Tax=Polaribacter marinivivus TaxID=1524260 RepID=A0ABV8R5J2_9FLAO